MQKTMKPICVLSTGGTISMERTTEGYRPVRGYLEKAMLNIPELKNPDMPNYQIHEFDKPIDSANMTPHVWNQMGQHIEKHYDNYSGFVILHGTDTMAYSASALSFMLENIDKPVILTGSQLPLFETRNDARENLINAIWLAGNYQVPEVCIYFNAKLFRGNRSTKIDANSFSAFASPNFPRLAKIGTRVQVRRDLFLERSIQPLHLQSIDPAVIGVLRIFPGMSIEMITHVFEAPLEALVLQTYGVGTAPEDKRFLEVIGDAVNRGVVIVNCSQCAYAKVKMSDYAAGSSLLNQGVISGADMTAEAAVTKLFYLFSKGLSPDQIKAQMALNLRGELTL